MLDKKVPPDLLANPKASDRFSDSQGPFRNPTVSESSGFLSDGRSSTPNFDPDLLEKASLAIEVIISF